MPSFELPPQKLGNLERSKRIEFVRAGTLERSEKNEMKPGPSNKVDFDYWEIIENAKKNRKKEIKEENDYDEDVVVISEKIQKPKHPRIAKKRPTNWGTREINGLLKAAKDGDLENVQHFLSVGVPINSGDFYGWTPLLCAAAEGNFDVCKFLLENGADMDCMDRKGRGLATISAQNGHQWLLLKLFQYFSGQEKLENTTERMEFCEICDKFVEEREVPTHLGSIVHQLNDKKTKGAAKQSGIMIGPNNIGYRLMCANGWTEQQGLGKNSDGHKFPIRTLLKRNRTGLGMEKMKAKVTHFGPYDVQAVKNERKTVRKAGELRTKAEVDARRSKEKIIEKEFRAGFLDNDSVYDYFNK